MSGRRSPAPCTSWRVVEPAENAAHWESSIPTGVYAGDKKDPRIAQTSAVAIAKSYKGLRGKKLGISVASLPVGEPKKKLSFLLKHVKYRLTPKEAGQNHVVLRGFKHAVHDLDLRLIEHDTGRILGSSYSTKSGELISTPLKAGERYSVVVERASGFGTVPYVLSLKQVSETDNRWYTPLAKLNEGESKTITGMVHTLTRFAHFTRFAEFLDVKNRVRSSDQPQRLIRSTVFDFKQTTEAIVRLLFALYPLPMTREHIQNWLTPKAHAVV